MAQPRGARPRFRWGDDGPVMAAGARVDITVDGHAGHAALPHLTRDPMLASAHLLIALHPLDLAAVQQDHP